jgi:hypothetical protein
MCEKNSAVWSEAMSTLRGTVYAPRPSSNMIVNTPTKTQDKLQTQNKSQSQNKSYTGGKKKYTRKNGIRKKYTRKNGLRKKNTRKIYT